METKQFTLTVRDEMTARFIFDALEKETPDDTKPDRIALEFHDEKGVIEVAVSDDGGQRRQKFKTYSLAFPVVFFPAVGGVCFMAGGKAISIEMPADDLPALLAEIEARNAQHGFERPSKLPLDLERVPDEPRVIKLPNGAAERDTHRALMRYPAWEANNDLCTRYHEGREKTTVVFQPPEILEAFQAAPEKALKALDERFLQIKSETTADVIDILFHHWKINKDELQGKRAAITLKRICEYRGIEPRNENLENHWQAVRDARAIRLTNGGVDTALFEMSSVDFSSTEVPAKDTAYFYAPGFFLQSALEENRIYFAPFLENIWRLDPYRNTEAKRLARFLRGEWRLNPEKYLDPKNPNGRRWRSWRELLAEAGAFPDQWDAGARHTARKIEGIEKAIQTLYDLEFLAEAGDAIYHPDDRRLITKLPRKGRLAAWLELRVCLLPAADIRDALKETSARRVATRERDAKALAEARAKQKLRAEKPRKRAKRDP